MKPSAMLILEADEVLAKRRAQRRAERLVRSLAEHALQTPEIRRGLELAPAADADPGAAGAVVADAVVADIAARTGQLIREVAAEHPKLLVWLAGGRVGALSNLFGLLVGVAESVPLVRGLVDRVLLDPVAGRAPWRTVLHERVVEEIRCRLNEWARRDRFGTVLRAELAPGLAAVGNPASAVDTDELRKVTELAAGMSGGCIGVSGPRGSGKSTLIRRFCGPVYGVGGGAPADRSADPSSGSLPGHVPDGSSYEPRAGSPMPGLRMVVEAPIQYDAREFLVHLYVCLCQRVLTDPRLNRERPRFPARPATCLRWGAAVALLAFAAEAGHFAATGQWLLPRHVPARLPAAVGAAACLLAAALTLGWQTRLALAERRAVLTLVTDARQRLQRLRFQRTETASHSARLTAPLGTGLGGSRSRAFQEQRMTMPELVADYRDFVSRTVTAVRWVQGADSRGWPRRIAADWWAGWSGRRNGGTGAGNGGNGRRREGAKAAVRLVIGIDEMDRISDPSRAGSFLNDLAAIFGIPYCVYLVAISAETLVAGRGPVPLKTASDTAMDEMVWIEPLELSQASALLERRVVGMTLPFTALCHALSGGLPRDLLRIARAVFRFRAATGHEDLATLAHQVLVDEVRALRHLTLSRAARLTVPAAPRLIEQLDNQDRVVAALDRALAQGRPVDIDEALEPVTSLYSSDARREKFVDQAGSTAAAAEVCDNFAAALSFLLTSHQVFVTTLDRTTALLRDPGDPSRPRDDSPISQLAQVRGTLGLSPYLACARLARFRAAFSSPEPTSALLGPFHPYFLTPPTELADTAATAEQIVAWLRRRAGHGV